MNPKKMLVDIIASYQRIWDYEKWSGQNQRAENNIADRCIRAYREAIQLFCKKFDEQEADYSTIADKLDTIISKLPPSNDTKSDYL